MLIEEYVQLAREEIVDVEYNMAELVDLAWNSKIHSCLNLNEKPMEGCGRPTNANSQASF